MNRLRDFRMYCYQKGPCKGQESMWLFRIGCCDDPKRIVASLRSLPEWEHYCYANEDHVWAVKPSRGNGVFLARLFDNFVKELTLARRQPELPLLDMMPVIRQLPWEGGTA